MAQPRLVNDIYGSGLRCTPEASDEPRQRGNQEENSYVTLVLHGSVNPQAVIPDFIRCRADVAGMSSQAVPPV